MDAELCFLPRVGRSVLHSSRNKFRIAFSVCVCVCATSESWLAPSAMWVPETEFRFGVSAAITFPPLNPLTGPSTGF